MFNGMTQALGYLAAVGAALVLIPASAVLAQDPIAVEAIEVRERALVEEVPLSGSVYTPHIAQVSGQVAGLVQRVQVDAGDQVEAGDLLIQLDPELNRIARDEAEAERDRARVLLEDARRRLTEARSLAKQNNIAASDVRSREAEAKQREADVRVAEARLRRVEAELARHSIRAPFTGTVSARSIAPGEWVTPGTALLELVETEHLRVDFQVPQRYFSRVQENTELALKFDAYPDRVFSADVDRRVPLSQPGTRTFLLRGRLRNAPPVLIPGMSVSGLLRVDTGHRGLAVPRDALLRYPDGRITVWVLSAPAWGKPSPVEEQNVVIGLSSAGWTEIESGLEEGQMVVTRGNEALREGRLVIPQPPSNEANEYREP